ncbi:unnamed protein product [Cuscuta epithymum]|uniref:Alliinase C-terminal domain-containing protein n=2 Tax=Cuscuta epithymum TaxID=186058 RepID=A0AAV0F8T9_9ASTE|nr:unnamed protein product [Cuscuta epithymum]
MGVTIKTSAPKRSFAVSPTKFIAENGKLNVDALVNLDHGDPTMFVPYWEKMSEGSIINFPGSQSLSYFSETKSVCWFLEPKLEEEIRRLHRTVGNAAVGEEDCIVVGSGSSQLIQAALYALSSPDSDQPLSVICAAPYYSSYPEIANLLRSRSYKWGGDARNFDKEEAYIELVTTPNNPDGAIREPVVNRPQGTVIYDFAYYWPHYTAISSPPSHDLMLFTFSKCTGHAGSRIGWAIVRDKEVAKKMTKFIEVSTIGVSKDSQLRAAKILGVVSDSCFSGDDFFAYSRNMLKERWQRLRQVVKGSDLFHVQKYPILYCHFSKAMIETLPAFAWMKTIKGEVDCVDLLKDHKILARIGTKFGVESNFARISMVSKDEDFNTFLRKLSIIQGRDDPTNDENHTQS